MLVFLLVCEETSVEQEVRVVSCDKQTGKSDNASESPPWALQEIPRIPLEVSKISAVCVPTSALLLLLQRHGRVSRRLS